MTTRALCSPPRRRGRARGISGDAQQFWDAMYRGRDPQRPGRPHPYLVDELGAASPGTALELGCGDGANAIWLAARGWAVTAVDVSQVALDRVAAFARRAGVASHVRWERADLRDWTTTETFDLAAAFFLHTPLELDYPSTTRRAAEQVRADGTLLVIGHYTLPPWAWEPDNTDGLLSAGELASALALDDRTWSIDVADQLARSVNYDGQQHVILDAVLHALRAEWGSDG
ncbi:MAG: class I SAM-dependent methyltransferase [Actinomycetota bacterium]|nr:class I SAM-dependent methyltransferase [Actinomycetota bacterium]